MLHAEANGPLRYYVHDPMFEGRSDVVHPTTLRDVQALIEHHNPFAAYLRQLGAEEHEHHMLELSWKPAAQQSAELASIVYKPDFCAPTERTLCVYRSSDQFYDAHPDLQPQGHDGYFIPMQHPLGDAMQYPLLFWGAHKDGGYCRQSEYELANHERDMGNEHHHKISLLEHARYHVLAPERSVDGTMDPHYMLSTQGGHVLPFNRFQLSDRLAGEWLINSFVKQEDERLKFHRSNTDLLTPRATTELGPILLGYTRTRGRPHHNDEGACKNCALKGLTVRLHVRGPKGSTLPARVRTTHNPHYRNLVRCPVTTPNGARMARLVACGVAAGRIHMGAMLTGPNDPTHGNLGG